MDSNENTSLVKTNGGGDQPYGADDVNIDMKGVEAEDEVKITVIITLHLILNHD